MRSQHPSHTLSQSDPFPRCHKQTRVRCWQIHPFTQHIHRHQHPKSAVRLATLEIRQDLLPLRGQGLCVVVVSCDANIQQHVGKGNGLVHRVAEGQNLSGKRPGMTWQIVRWENVIFFNLHTHSWKSSGMWALFKLLGSRSQSQLFVISGKSHIYRKDWCCINNCLR